MTEKRRRDFQVVVLPNLYGDIITDEAAEFQGRVAALLDELGIPHGEIPIRLISSVIAVHTGPYPLGMGVLRKARLD